VRSRSLSWLISILLATLLTGPALAAQIRKPAVAGFFYPGAKRELASLVDRTLDEAPWKLSADEETVALICPHAGYLYSGRVAAYAFRQIRGGDYEVVVLIGPSHTMGFEGVSLYDGDYYETPLGKVRLEKNLAEALTRQSKAFRFLPQAHQKEHSLEVQLPFLQRSLADFSLLPLVMGSQSLSTCKELARALVRILRGKKALLIASSDLSHYHPSRVARKLDEAAMEAIQAMDGEALLQGVESFSCELCGAGPVATILLAAKQLGSDRVAILKYADSSEASGDSSAVVGYLAAAITKPKGSGASPASRESKSSLSRESRAQLLRMARRAIELYLDRGQVWEPQIDEPELRKPGAAFVTLTKGGELRGCIGLTEPLLPLHRAVTQCAIAAACSDPRFPPLQAEELSQLEIEISVLSPLREIQEDSEIQVGRDGILIEKGGRRGLLLPQVATEYHWDRRTFLEETCNKAGLPRDAWRQGAKILTFSAEIFRERR